MSVHVPEAVFRAIAYREADQSAVVLIALPDDDMHLSRVRPVEKTLGHLRVGRLAVSDSGVRLIYGEADPTSDGKVPPA